MKNNLKKVLNVCLNCIIIFFKNCSEIIILENVLIINYRITLYFIFCIFIYLLYFIILFYIFIFFFQIFWTCLCIKAIDFHFFTSKFDESYINFLIFQFTLLLHPLKKVYLKLYIKNILTIIIKMYLIKKVCKNTAI